MEFATPTTKAQMYAILEELFYRYRVKKESFQEEQLSSLVLKRLEPVTYTYSALRELATKLVAPEQQREIDARKSEIQKNITELTNKISVLEENTANQIATVENYYEQSLKKVEEQAFKNGLVSSGIVIDKITALEEAKNDKIIALNIKKDQELSQLNAQLASQNELLENAETYFYTAHQLDVDKKYEEIKSEKEKELIEVFKYNNTLDEKEQRYENSLIQYNANLHLKYMSINATEFSKDQLIEMGYYADVVRCVCGYYNTLSAGVAYNDFSNETKLPIYLDDYYSNILYMYQSKAGL